VSDGDRILIEQRPLEGLGLGRNINHDPKSRSFLAARAIGLRDVRHVHHGMPLNQGRLGSCTMNALLQCSMCTPVWNGVWNWVEADAVRGYTRATQIDPFDGSWPPTDTGSDGVSVCKVGIEWGLLDRYEHTFDFQHSLESLVLQPDITGTYWYDTMYYPDADGRVHPTGTIVGGHEYVRIGLEVTNRRVWFFQSWGPWGLTIDGIPGFFYMTWDDYESLLIAQNGDVTVPHFLTGPPPFPVAPYFSSRTSRVFHDRHPGARREVEYRSWEEAIASGRSPCRFCKPRPV
jgi:hypothetical protein